MFTRRQWTLDLLSALGNGTPKEEIVNFVEGWTVYETNTNSGARFNLLNTTEQWEGATNFNSVGVKNYPNYQTGIEATVLTLRNGYYPNLLYALSANNPSGLGDLPHDDILAELHTWCGSCGYGRAFVSTGETHSLDAFDYGTSPYLPNPVVKTASPIQIEEANERWQACIPDIPIDTGIYKSWVEQWITYYRQFGPPLTHERPGKNWQGKPIVYQIFAHATCEWDGSPHWFSASGKIN